MNLTTALDMTRNLLVEYGFKDWIACINPRLTGPLARTVYSRKQIEFNRAYLELNSEKEVLDTILHELGHVIAKARFGHIASHGREWKTVCRELGLADPRRCATGDVKMPAKKPKIQQIKGWSVHCGCNRKPKDWFYPFAFGHPRLHINNMTQGCPYCGESYTMRHVI